MSEQERSTRLWNKLKVKQIGIVSLPIYIIFAGIIFIGMYTENIPVDLLGGLAVILALGWLLGSIGDAIPVFNKFGGATILAIFIPAVLVFLNILPQNSIDAVNFFMNDVNFKNLYIFALIAGSILGMNRNILVEGFARMILPMASGFILALIIPSIIGGFLGIGFEESLFYIVTPAMAGGLAGGVLPLGLGYSAVTGAAYGELVAVLAPATILGNFIAITGAAIMSQVGANHSELTGNGTLVKTGEMTDRAKEENESPPPISHQLIGTGLFLIAMLYVSGTIFESIIGLPTPVIVIFLAALLKYGQILPKNVEQGAVQLYRSLSTVLNMPIMVAIGVVFLSLEDVLAILSWQYLVVLLSVVATLALNGYVMSRFVNMYPVESSILSINQASMGGTGNIAILSSADREEMMPFAQVATRIGGALTVSVMITLMNIIA